MLLKDRSDYAHHTYCDYDCYTNKNKKMYKDILATKLQEKVAISYPYRNIARAKEYVHFTFCN